MLFCQRPSLPGWSGVCQEPTLQDDAGGLREPCDASVAFGASKFCGAEPLMEVPSRQALVGAASLPHDAHMRSGGLYATGHLNRRFLTYIYFSAGEAAFLFSTSVSTLCSINTPIIKAPKKMNGKKTNIHDAMTYPLRHKKSKNQANNQMKISCKNANPIVYSPVRSVYKTPITLNPT